MRSIYLSSLVAIGAVSALTLATLPAQAQFVSIPVTNGNFAVTNTGAGSIYSTLPTFLSPAGTIGISAAANPGVYMGFQSPTPITTNTPAGAVLLGLDGTANLTDGRTATFTGGSAAVRGLATVTGAASVTTTYPGFFAGSSGYVPPGATVSFTVQSGAVTIPAASLSAYPTPQFTIPVTGGSFTVTDAPGTGHATVTANSILTPLGTANLVLTLPSFNNGANGAGYPTPPLTVTVGGMADGSVALNDGRTAIVSNQLVSLTANTQVASGFPAGGEYWFNATMLQGPAVITGTITGGSISVPQSAVAFPPVPVQPPVVQPHVVQPPVVQPPVVQPPVVQPPVVQPPVVQPPVVQPPVVQSPVVQPPKQEFVLGFAQTVNLGGEPTEYLKLVEVERVPVYPEDLPEVEASPLAYSRIHPGVNAYNR